MSDYLWKKCPLCCVDGAIFYRKGEEPPRHCTACTNEARGTTMSKACELCDRTEGYCDKCSTCHLCLEEAREHDREQIERFKKEAEDLLARAMNLGGWVEVKK